MSLVDSQQASSLPEVTQPDAGDGVGQSSQAAAEAIAMLHEGKTLEDVRIEGLVFKGVFAKPVRMKNVALVRPTFERVRFEDEVEFAGCTLERPVFARRGKQFAKGMSLNGCTIISAHIRNLTVDGSLLMRDIRTRGKFRLAHSEIAGNWECWDSNFNGWVDVEKIKVAGVADLRSIDAVEGFVLKGCHFKGDALFRGASIAKKFDARNSQFDAMLDLSKAKLHDFSYLENIVQGDKQRFAFWNIVGDRLLVTPEQIDGRLASEDSGDFTTAMHEYAFLKRGYGTLHRYTEEDWAFYRFKVNQRRCCSRSWLRPWTKVGQFLDWLILDLGCGYCTNPFRAVRAALILILLYAVIYMIGIEALAVDSIHPPFGGEITSIPNRITLGLFKSTSTFITGIGGLGDMAHGWMNFVLITEALFGTLLWGLFIVAFSRKVIR